MDYRYHPICKLWWSQDSCNNFIYIPLNKFILLGGFDFSLQLLTFSDFCTMRKAAPELGSSTMSCPVKPGKKQHISNHDMHWNSLQSAIDSLALDSIELSWMALWNLTFSHCFTDTMKNSERRQRLAPPFWEQCQPNCSGISLCMSLLLLCKILSNTELTAVRWRVCVSDAKHSFTLFF